MKDSFTKLTDLLRELFQLDQADLDFGIYRIMNARRDEINRFLEKDLLPQVREAFGEYKSADKASLKQELDKAIDQAKALGYDPDTAPKVQELREQYDASSVDVAGLENEVYDHLYSFFKRYYDDGDFISLRRYKEGIYAIPYEGEEVKLYWANHDQYYIKTTENFRDYAFKLADDSRVHFKIVEADTEKDNVKSANGKDRRFFLVEANPVTEENGELIIRFEYRADEQKRKQDQLNTEMARRIMELLKTMGLDAWGAKLIARWKRVDGAIMDRTVLEKHFADYTQRNTFDYFIHKNLGEFLRRELDFYIKNEVMRLDDVESEAAPRVEQYLSKIKVIRRIAHKIIDFLAQIEDFQKKLWLKKKFVVETNYCITLDRIPEELYPEITASEAQREAWVRLFAIDEIKGDMVTPAYTAPLTVEFLKANPYLVLDTRLFDSCFKARLIEAVDNIDEHCDGLLVNSENFQALNLLSKEYEQCVEAIYVDPPYNAAATQILYKNEYMHSSWIALMRDRLQLSRAFLKENAITCTTIDDYELHRLIPLLEQVFGDDNHLATVAIRNNPSGRSTVKGFSINHEYALFFSQSPTHASVGRLPHTEEQRNRYNEKDSDGGQFEWENFRKNSSGSFRADRPKQFFPVYYNRELNTLRLPKLEWIEKTRSWKILEEPEIDEVEIWPKDDAQRERVWRYGVERTEATINELIVKEMKGKPEIYKRKYLQTKGSLPRTWWDKAEYSARDNGTRALVELFGSEKGFDFPKAPEAVKDCLRVCSAKGDALALDYFAGSGTTGHAVINLNREDGGERKYVLVEMGQYFDTVMKPRIQKVIYANDWKDGKPISRNTGISHMFKYLRLESYEDALANIQLIRTDAQQELLESSASFRESYMLKYMLDTESRGSRSLLTIDQFEDPFSYQLLVGTGSVGETKAVNADLVETFNWLLGLRVQRIKSILGYRTVEGTNPKGEKVFVIWRKIRDLDETDPIKVDEARRKANDDLDAFFQEEKYNQAESRFDIIYVNGDNNLMNIPVEPGSGEPPYRVRLIEEEFKRLMFDVKDV